MAIARGKNAIIAVIPTLLLASLLVIVPATVSAINYEAYRGVLIGHFLEGVFGDLNTKFNKMGSAKDFMVYINFEDASSIGAGHYVAHDQNNNVVSCGMIYYALAGGFANRDLIDCSIPDGSRYPASVIQDGHGSYCYIATTYGGFNEQICTAKNRATTAGNIAHTYSAYSSTNTLSHKFDHLESMYWSGVQGKYLPKFFTDSETVDSKCYTGDQFVGDELLHRAPNGVPEDLYDDVGNGPTAFTEDDCLSDQTVWRPYGID